MRSTQDQRGVPKHHPKTQRKEPTKRKYKGLTRMFRRCRTDIKGSYRSGIYFPNYLVGTTGLTSKLPDSKKCDSSIDSFLSEAVKQKILEKSSACGLLCVVDQNSKEFVGSSATWWILEHNGQKLIVTALHCASRFEDPLFYVVKDYTLLGKNDIYEIFKQDWKMLSLDKFIQIQPRLDLLKYSFSTAASHHLRRARKDWLETNQQEPWFASANLDVELGLQPHPALDILFFDLPKEYCSLPSFSCIDSVSNGSSFGHLAYHHIYEEIEEDLYICTTDPKSVPAASELVNQGQSVSLGVLVQYGPIATVISTNTEQSSGGPHFDSDLKVFGICISSYYDVPLEEEEEEQDKPNYVTQAADLINFDVAVSETGDATKTESRNRNLILTFSHPGVKHLLQQL